MKRTYQLNEKAAYEAPKVVTFGSKELMSQLGPSLSCTGFGGSATC